MMLSDRFESFLSAHSSRLWTLARGAAAAGLLVASAHAQASPTANFAYDENFATEGVDIPGIAFGANAAGKPVVWVSAYCGQSCAWPAGSISEIDPLTGVLLTQHPLPSGQWGTTGPTGLAYDAADEADPNSYLWVAGYNSERVYKVLIQPGPSGQTNLVVQSSWATTGQRPLGGLAFDGQYLWLTKGGGDSNVYKYDQNGGVVATYATSGDHKGGLDCVGPYLFVVDSDAAKIQVRSITNFALIGTPYDFPPSAWDEPNGRSGDLGIDPISGDAFWGARSYGKLHKLHLLDAYTPYCFGDDLVSACPCNNAGDPGHGCANSLYAAGARLSASGVADVSSPSLALLATSMSGNSALFFQGTWHANVPFDDGKLCLAGTLVRIGLKGVVGGAATNPSGGSPPISVVGGVPAVGGTRFYQAVYRNSASFCSSSVLNRTNGMAITWRP